MPDRPREDPAGLLWTTFNTRSMLGGALLGQKRYADAEPLLVFGLRRDEAVRRPLRSLRRVRHSADRGPRTTSPALRVVEDKPQEAARWRATLAGGRTDLDAGFPADPLVRDLAAPPSLTRAAAAPAGRSPYALEEPSQPDVDTGPAHRGAHDQRPWQCLVRRGGRSSNRLCVGPTTPKHRARDLCVGRCDRSSTAALVMGMIRGVSWELHFVPQ